MVEHVLNVVGGPDCVHGFIRYCFHVKGGPDDVWLEPFLNIKSHFLPIPVGKSTTHRLNRLLATTNVQYIPYHSIYLILAPEIFWRGPIEAR